MAAGGGGVELAFLLEDLRELASSVVPQDFAITSIDADEEVGLVARLRRFAMNAQILFCTHAMLVRAYQSKWAAFGGAPTDVLIDEGHEFERNFASLFAKQVSVLSLRNRLRKFEAKSGMSSRQGTVLYRAKRACDRLRHEVSALDEGGSSIDLARLDAECSVVAALAELNEAIRSKKLNDVSSIKDARAAVGDALQIARGPDQLEMADFGRQLKRGSRIGWIEFSPDRRFPSIVAGNADVGGLLGGFWKQVTGGVVIASATLYLPGPKSGEPSCEYASEILAIPKCR